MKTQTKQDATARPLHKVFLANTAGGVCAGLIEITKPFGATNQETAQWLQKVCNEHAALNAVAQCLQRRNSVMPTKESTEALATLQTLRAKEGK